MTVCMSREVCVLLYEAIIELRGEKRKAMADQLTTVSKQRLGSKLGALSSEDMTRVEAAIVVQLALNLK